MARRILCCAAALLLLLGTLPVRTAAIGTSAAAAILVDADSGRVLYEQNADARMRIASTTKILTALVAVQDGDLRELVTVGPAAAGTEGSSMYLKTGERLRLETLLYGLLLSSGNDAAVAIAEHVSGSVPAFVDRMNETARRLGMTHSSFANPNGLDHENHYSTARDMALLARAAVRNETLLRIASTKTVTVGGRTMTNHNKLLSRVEGCIGLKTGYTRAAGRTLVSCAERNGRRLIAVTLQDGNDWLDHQALYAYGFSEWPLQSGVAAGEPVGTVPIAGGSRREAKLLAGASFSWPLRTGESLERSLVLPTPLRAPLKAGTAVGEVVFTLSGAEVGRVPLLAGQMSGEESAAAGL